MNIIYGYSNCSDSKYNELFDSNNSFVLRADQKYHSLLIKGLKENGCNVTCLSGLPINKNSYKKIIVNEKDEHIDSIKYHYYKSLNIPVLRHICLFFGGFINVLKQNKKDTYLIYDYQNLSNAYGLLLASKLKGIKSTVIVMDLPEYLVNNKLNQKLYELSFKLANSFVLLTKQMNDKVNLINKPYIVIEGMVDSNIKETNETKYVKNIVMYAGSLSKKYGLDNLAKGFIKANIEDSELWIYGDGDYKEELIDITKEHNNVIYKGICSNEEIVKEERKVSLLVNPRPSNEEYTKYSFPSKTIEYMSSGTPLLTTKLEGIPTDYYRYIYLIEEETIEGISNKIKEIFSFDKTTRTRIGSEAKEFVYFYKNNKQQANKLLKLIKNA